MMNDSRAMNRIDDDASFKDERVPLRTLMAKRWKKLISWLRFIIVILSIGLCILLLMYVHMPNGHLTYLGYALISALALPVIIFGFYLVPKNPLGYALGKSRPLIVVGMSIAISYAILGHALILYTYLHGKKFHTKPLKVLSMTHQAARTHSRYDVTGDHLYFKKGSVYPHTIFEGSSLVTRFFIMARFSQDELVTILHPFIDTSKPVIVYYKVTPFAFLATAIKSDSPLTTIRGKKYPLIIVSIADTYNYPLGFY